MPQDVFSLIRSLIHQDRIRIRIRMCNFLLRHCYCLHSWRLRGEKIGSSLCLPLHQLLPPRDIYSGLGQQLLCPWVIDDGDHIGRAPPGVQTQRVPLKNIAGFLAPQGVLVVVVVFWDGSKPSLPAIGLKCPCRLWPSEKLTSLLQHVWRMHYPLKIH